MNSNLATDKPQLSLDNNFIFSAIKQKLMLLIEKKFHTVFQKCFLCPSAVLSGYLAKFHLRYSFIIKKYKSFLNSLDSSINSALVIRLQVEIMMICQGKIIVICNQQYQVYESCSSCFTFTNTNIDKIICIWKTNQDNPNL